MQVVNFTEFRNKASSLFSKVEKGEVIKVLRHGKPIAEIVPISFRKKKRFSWKKPGLRLNIKGAALSQAILEERENS